YEAKRHHQSEQRAKDEAHAHCDHQAFEKVSRVITHTPREVLVDVNGRESFDPGFAETEALVAIDSDRLPPSGGDIEQQQWRKENAEVAVQLTQPAVHNSMPILSVK